MDIAIPPGLQGPLSECTSGAYPQARDSDWMTYPRTKLFTNVFIWSEGRILLGYKKRGFGKGMYNGFGGKVEEGETPAQAAARELKEEAGIEADLTPHGTLIFYSEGYEYAHLIHIFCAEQCKGEPVETDEMRPEWFSIPPKYNPGGSHYPDAAAQTLPPIPLHMMWPDDELWFPIMFSKRPFAGRVDFARLGSSSEFTESKMVKWWFGTAA